MSCFFCKGDMSEGFTTHVVNLEKCIIIIKNVPCNKCEQCGEVTYTGAVVKQLEKTIDLLAKSLTEIAIVNYTNEQLIYDLSIPRSTNA